MSQAAPAEMTPSEITPSDISFLYGAMLQEGSLLPQMLLPDVPVNINGFTPQNFSMQFEGAVPASEALARSLNIPAVTMLQRYGVPKFHHMLQQMGFKTINRSASHYGLSLILGGAEATLWDVTNAYAQMGRQNMYPITKKAMPIAVAFLVMDSCLKNLKILILVNGTPCSKRR